MKVGSEDFGSSTQVGSEFKGGIDQVSPYFTFYRVADEPLQAISLQIIYRSLIFSVVGTHQNYIRQTISADTEFKDPLWNSQFLHTSLKPTPI
jgi:hypothetical protein